MYDEPPKVGSGDYLAMKARAFYNEIDPVAAAWLRELIRGGAHRAGRRG